MSGLEGISLGRYRLQRRLGRGGMAEVYLATDDQMQRDVAVKVVSSSQMEFVERFVREVGTIGNLHHDHILPAYDYGEQDYWHYLVMPYIENGTLSDLLQEGPLSLTHAGELLQQIADGLQYAHQHGLIHRDIKPSNILLRDDHHAYLADFGLARALESSSDLTQTGTLLGTPEYMAPEIADGPAGMSSDIYALAILLYQMITGRVPFQGDSAISVFWKHIRDTPQPPSYINPEIPPEVDEVLMRALEKEPELRYPTPLALSLAYQEAIGIREKLVLQSLYETETMQRGDMEAVLPGVSVSSPLLPETPRQQMQMALPASRRGTVRPPRRLRRQSPALTPVMMAQPLETITPEHIIMPTPRPAPVRLRKRHTNRLIGGIIIGLVFFLVVSSLLTVLAIQSHQQGNAATTSTNLTGNKKTPQVQSTQQVATSTTGTANAQATQQATDGIVTAITGKTPLLSDPLNAPDNGWPDDGSSCAFTSSGYQVVVNAASTLQPCISGTLQYSNAAFETHVTLLSGDDAGIIFRADADGSQFYDFEITNSGQFYFRDRAANQYNYLIHNTTSSAIQPGGTSNTLLVIAKGSLFQFFINGTFVDQIQDATLTSGQIGLVAGTLQSTSAEAIFSGLKVYPVA
jgi:serine/threonine protein kinase